MTVIKIIQIIDQILNLCLGLDATAPDSDQTASDTQTQDPRIAQLLDCCNAVLERLYGEYTLDYAHTVVDVKDGCAHLDSNVYRILKLTSSSGDDVDFKFSADGIVTDRDGRYNMTYARLPQTLALHDKVVLPDPRFTHRLFIYGVIAEYFRRTGDYASSESWAQKFDDALTVTVELRNSGFVKSRRWLQ